MIFNFIDPNHGISCVAEYDEEGSTLLFDFADYEATSSMFSNEVVNEVREWCMSSHINCGSIYRAHEHLEVLELIKSDLIELEVKAFKLNP